MWSWSSVPGLKCALTRVGVVSVGVTKMVHFSLVSIGLIGVHV